MVTDLERNRNRRRLEELYNKRMYEYENKERELLGQHRRQFGVQYEQDPDLEQFFDGLRRLKSYKIYYRLLWVSVLNGRAEPTKDEKRMYKKKAARLAEKELKHEFNPYNIICRG